MANRIGTISIDFVTDQKADAWPLQQRMKHLINHSILPRLEQVFDALDDGSSLLLLDQLQIDLGRLGKSDLDTIFVSRLLEQIADQLKRARTAAVPASAKVRQLPLAQALLYALLEFLRSGMVPDLYLPVFREVREQQLYEAFIRYPALQRNLVELIRTDSRMEQRLSLQFSPAFTAKMYSLLREDQGREESAGKMERPRAFSVMRECIPIGDDSAYTSTGTRETPPPFSVMPEEFFPAVRDIGFTAATGKNVVENAGLVLLHPWLSGDNEQGFALFEEAGLAKDNEFVDEQARERALHLLQYLVWGKERQPEHRMVLDKLLCGFPAERPVDRFLRLTDSEKAACAKIARLVSRAWPGIAEMSLAALRETFLQRVGQISSVPLGIKLTVEKRTLDILIKKLPHGLGIVRFPWMTKMLWIDWDY